MKKALFLSPSLILIILILLTALLAGIILIPAQTFYAQAYHETLPNCKDAFLEGELTAILERNLGWPRGSFRVSVYDGKAVITLFEDDTERREQIERLSPVEGIQEIELKIDKTKRGPLEKEQAYSFLGLTPNTIPFPVGDLFWPLIADPKQPQFFVGYRRYNTQVGEINITAVGYGETFGFYYRSGRGPIDGLQVNISGGLFAQFNMDTSSKDLINADYTIGFPVTYRRGHSSARLRFYHQSSHLGDEYILSNNPQRINLSFESLEFVISRDWIPLRVYLGGEYLFRRDPSDLKRFLFHGGIELYGSLDPNKNSRWITGFDIKAMEEHEWSIDSSLSLGREFGAARPGNRRLRIMLEGYKGHTPYGQFYKEKIYYYGLGVYLGF